MQPDNPAQLGGKIYEMMGMALTGKWSTPGQFQSTVNQPHTPEIVEAEVVEPAGGQKWERTVMWTFFVFYPFLSVLSFNTAYGVTGEIVFLKNMGIDSNI